MDGVRKLDRVCRSGGEGADGRRVAVLLDESYTTLAATAPPGPLNVNDDEPTVEAVTARLKVAETEAARAMFVAPFAGVEALTVSGTGVAGTVNVQLYAVPSCAPSVAAIVGPRRAV